MTREERIQICIKCEHKRNTLKDGIICDLTGKQAEFEGNCEDHVIDEEIINHILKKEEQQNITNRVAPRWKRFVTFLIDYTAFIILSFIVGLLFAILGIHHLITNMPDFILGFIIVSIFYIVFESTLGQTPGKLLMKTIVVDKDGNKPVFTRILGRTLCRFIPFDALSFFKSDAIGWHDSITDTRVIEKKYCKKRQNLNDNILDEIEL